MKYRKTCKNCGKEFVSDSRLDISGIERCDVCRISLSPGYEEFDPDAESLLHSEDETHSETAVTQDSSTMSIDELELVYIGTSIVVQLPIMSGVVGRVPANCDAIKTFSTISRNQFVYNYSEDGSLNITNKSQYGTIVNGVYLDIDETITVVPPAVIGMGGCYTFELRKKEL